MSLSLFCLRSKDGKTAAGPGFWRFCKIAGAVVYLLLWLFLVSNWYMHNVRQPLNNKLVEAVMVVSITIVFFAAQWWFSKKQAASSQEDDPAGSGDVP